MYLAGCNCPLSGITPPRTYRARAYPRAATLAGLEGIDPFGLVNAAMSLVRPGASNAIQGAATPSIVTNVQTQVSPQISPVFVQQEKPQDSAVGVATMQTAPATFTTGDQIPGTPVTGAIPGVDYGASTPYATSPLIPASGALSTKTAALAGIGLIGAALLLGGKKKAAPKKGKRK